MAATRPAGKYDGLVAAREARGMHAIQLLCDQNFRLSSTASTGVVNRLTIAAKFGTQTLLENTSFGSVWSVITQSS